MYLPILLFERYGSWGAVAIFAIPNIAGVIYFGRYLKSKAQSSAMVIAHRPIMLLFSAVTIAFHGFFFGWFWYAELKMHPGFSILIGVAIMLAALATSGLSDRVYRWVCMIVYLFSFMFLFHLIAHVWGPFADEAEPMGSFAPPIWKLAPSGSWMWLTPVMISGFLFCPFFDLTFHRAYQHVGGGSSGKRTFSLFGIFFGIMLIMTCVYAISGFQWAVYVHLLTQGWITTTLHMREIRSMRIGTTRQRSRWRITLLLPIAIAMIAPLGLLEYRHWLVFYGLMVPVYALLIGVRRLVGRTPADTFTITIVMLLCVPFGAVGFLTDHAWAVAIPPIAIALWAVFGGQTVAKCESVESSLRARPHDLLQ